MLLINFVDESIREIITNNMLPIILYYNFFFIGYLLIILKTNYDI